MIELGRLLQKGYHRESRTSEEEPSASPPAPCTPRSPPSAPWRNTPGGRERDRHQGLWSRSNRSSGARSPQTTHQHLAGGGLLLQAGCLDAEALLVAQVDKLPAVVFRDVLHVLGCRAQRGAVVRDEKQHLQVAPARKSAFSDLVLCPTTDHKFTSLS